MFLIISGMRPPGPPLARPILPRERNAVDRVIEYLVGDGPQNRYLTGIIHNRLDIQATRRNTLARIISVHVRMICLLPSPHLFLYIQICIDLPAVFFPQWYGFEGGI